MTKLINLISPDQHNKKKVHKIIDGYEIKKQVNLAFIRVISTMALCYLWVILRVSRHDLNLPKNLKVIQWTVCCYMICSMISILGQLTGSPAWTLLLAVWVQRSAVNVTARRCWGHKYSREEQRVTARRQTATDGLRQPPTLRPESVLDSGIDRTVNPSITAFISAHSNSHMCIYFSPL